MYPMLLILVSLHLLEISAQKPNNVCKDFSDYVTMENNTNCWNNPDMYSSPERIANRHGFEFQNHFIETEDGYHLTVFRIQDRFSGQKKQSLLIHHGLGSSAIVFMITGIRSMAFFLAENGYDVWLANHRGNPYSTGHSYLNDSDPEYWNFSYHEIGLYDLPAVLEYIAKKTGHTKTIFIGHSMGGTSALVYASLKKEHAEKYLKGLIGLNPASSFNYIVPHLEYIAPFAYSLVQQLFSEGVRVVAPDPEKIRRLVIPFCTRNPMICMTLVSVLSGPDENEMPPEESMVLLWYHPARTSLKCFLHYLQNISVRKFRQFDYGQDHNVAKYSSKTPPDYPVSNITIPVHIVYCMNDYLVPHQTAQWLFEELQTTEKSLNMVPENGIKKFNHFNLLLAKNIKQYFYGKLVEMLKELEMKN